MKVKQFYDKALAHGSYAVLSGNEVAVVDPARNPAPYYQFAEEHHAKIVAVIETHPHADFVSSHLEIHQKTGATIYVSKLLGAEYPHEPFDDGEVIQLGEVQLKAMNTPGHSPDSISVLLIDEEGKEYALFSGDTLFVGDVGRPDLRESAGNITAQREELARMMYRSTRDKIMHLPDDVLVYPAHGAGSLCGKNLSDDLYSTIGREKAENYALQQMSEDEFVDILLEGQPFIPKYFGYNVDVNKKGARPFRESLEAVPRLQRAEELKDEVLVIDTRKADRFKAGHRAGSINIPDQEGDKFETWLGAIVAPGESFYLIVENEEMLDSSVRKAAKIGYESQIAGVLIATDHLKATSRELDLRDFKAHPGHYTIVDIRNEGEVANVKYFDNSINVPLPELRERVHELKTDKPLVVHCAGGYRSAAGSSILEAAINGHAEVYDLSNAIEEFK